MVIKIDLDGPKNPACGSRVGEIVERRRKYYLPKFKKTKNQTVESKKLEVKKGFLAEYVIRDQLGLPGYDPNNSDYSADMINPHGPRIGIKPRG